MSHHNSRRNINATIRSGLKTGSARWGGDYIASLAVIIVTERPSQPATHAQLATKALQLEKAGELDRAAELYARALDIFDPKSAQKGERVAIRRAAKHCAQAAVLQRTMPPTFAEWVAQMYGDAQRWTTQELMEARARFKAMFGRELA